MSALTPIKRKPTDAFTPPPSPKRTPSSSKVDRVARASISPFTTPQGLDSSLEDSLCPEEDSLCPDFSFKDPSPSRSSKSPPPLHRFRSPELIKDRFLKMALRVQSSRQISLFGRTIRVESLPDLMTGRHSWIGKITSGQEPLFQGINNNQILVKTFREDSILTTNCPSSRVYSDTSTHVLDQYQQMTEANIPVAKLFNYEDAREGCGFFLFERLSAPMPPPWNVGADPDQFTDQQKAYLQQVTSLFERCCERQIHADLQPSNLSPSNGILTFIDFREDKSKDEPEYEALRLDLPKMLRSFNCLRGDKIWNRLTQNFKSLLPKPSIAEESPLLSRKLFDYSSTELY